jgi:hypothetical protein
LIYRADMVAVLDAVIYCFAHQPGKVPVIPRSIRTSAYHFIVPLLNTAPYVSGDNNVMPNQVFVLCCDSVEIRELLDAVAPDKPMQTLPYGTRRLLAYLLMGIKKRCQQLMGLTHCTKAGTEATGGNAGTHVTTRPPSNVGHWIQ